jgi:hypothetical protein
MILPVDMEVLAEVDCGTTGRVANDEFAAPRDVPVDALPRRYVQDVRYASAAGNPPTTCAGTVSRTVWYRLTPGSAMGLAASTFGTTFDTVLAVYRDDGGNLSQVICNDDFRGPQSRVAWPADGTSSYLVMAGAYGAVPAVSIQIDFGTTERPANDFAASPTDLQPGGPTPFVQPSYNASIEPADPDLSCTGIYGESLWFTVTAPSNGTLTVSTAGSTYNTVLGVMDGALEVACNNNAGPAIQTSLASWAAITGRQYTVVVGSFLNRAGGTLNVMATAAP